MIISAVVIAGNVITITSVVIVVDIVAIRVIQLALASIIAAAITPTRFITPIGSTTPTIGTITTTMSRGRELGVQRPTVIGERFKCIGIWVGILAVRGPRQWGRNGCCCETRYRCLQQIEKVIPLLRYNEIMIIIQKTKSKKEQKEMEKGRSADKG